MASRKAAPDSLDFYPTPPWATRALCERVFPALGFPVRPLHFGRTVWEPACGEGHMSEVLKRYFSLVHASDIHPYGQHDVFDFLSSKLAPPARYYDWIVTNPPFNRTLDFTFRAIELAKIGVAMFVRTQWATEGIERYERLFNPYPPTLMAFFSERVPLCRGRWDPDGGTATAYCWLVWVQGRDPQAPFYIPPGQRKLLSRPDDVARFAAWSLPREAAE